MSLQKTKRTIPDLLFFLPLVYMFSLSFLTYLNLTSDTEVFGYYAYLQFFSFWRGLKPFVLVPVLIKLLFFSDYNTKEKICSLAALIGIFLICRFYYPNYFLLYAVSFCLAARNISYHSLSCVYLICSGTTLLFTFLLLAYGLVEDNVITRGSMVRHSLGLVHPNSLGMWGMLLLIYYIQYRQSKLKINDVFVMSASIAVFYLITGSRASLILSVLVLVLTMVFQYLKSERLSKYLLAAVFIGVLLIVFLWFFLVSIYTKENPVFLFLDKLFSGRLHLSLRALKDYPLSFLGHNITFSYHVDPLFTYTLVIYGLLGLIVFQSMFHIGALRLFRKNLPLILVTMMVFQFYNTQENVFLYHLFDLTMYAATCDLDS